MCDQPLVRANINRSITSFVLEPEPVPLHLLGGETSSELCSPGLRMGLNTIPYANTHMGEMSASPLNLIN